jgi:DNA-directed RNA polymerase specialized sigma24 family protein
VNDEQKQYAIFTQRFLRSCRVLHFLACRVLSDEQRARIAVQNCWRAAARNPPDCESEGAFRSWLVRVLIDEALTILHKGTKAEDAAETELESFITGGVSEPGADQPKAEGTNGSLFCR